MKATGTARWTRHDLRRTGATLLGEMEREPHVIDAALNHTSIHSQLAATHNGHAMKDDARLRSAAGLSGLWDGTPLRRVRAGDGAIILPGGTCPCI
jgi:hypothetical protein